MSKITNLINLSKLGVRKNAQRQQEIMVAMPPEATQYLQVIPSPTVNAVCCLKDVNNSLNGGDIKGPFENARLSMFTLPKDIMYVDYSIDASTPDDPQFIMGEKGKPLSAMFHTLLVYDVNYPADAPFHFCDGDDGQPIPFVDPHHACVDTLTALRGSAFKPFHVFYADNFVLWASFFAEIPILPPYYLVPFAISEGVTVFFIAHGEDKEKTLQAFLTEITRTQKDSAQVSHWTVISEILYNDKHGIFTCTRIKSVNGVIIGSII